MWTCGPVACEGGSTVSILQHHDGPSRPVADQKAPRASSLRHQERTRAQPTPRPTAAAAPGTAAHRLRRRPALLTDRAGRHRLHGARRRQGHRGRGPTAQARPIPPLASSAAPAVKKTESPAPAPKPTPSPTPSPTAVTEKGKGTFTVATSKGDAVGKGLIRRYRVEVEDGIGIDPQAAAQQVQTILGDRRSWTTDGKNGFKLVSDGVYDFTVKVASPDTVDRICGSA
ncbi:DUF3152 domain-containing protein [Kitasatospora arboriphila]